jgi:hypothetical protein
MFIYNAFVSKQVDYCIANIDDKVLGAHKKMKTGRVKV